VLQRLAIEDGNGASMVLVDVFLLKGDCKQRNCALSFLFLAIVLVKTVEGWAKVSQQFIVVGMQ